MLRKITIRHLRVPALGCVMGRSNPIILGIASRHPLPSLILAITEDY